RRLARPVRAERNAERGARAPRRRAAEDDPDARHEESPRAARRRADSRPRRGVLEILQRRRRALREAGARREGQADPVTGWLAPALARRLARRRLRLGDLFAAPALELGLDVVVNPLRVPPLDRQDCDAVQIDAEVQMIAAGEAGLAGLAQDLLLLDRVALLHVDGAQVAVERVEAKTVVEDH